MHEQPLAVCLLELLLARLTSTATKDQLGPQLPLLGDVPVVGSLLIDDWVIVLEVSAEALSLERDPQSVLVHRVGVLGPVAEVVGVEGECLAQVLDGLGVFVAENLNMLCQWVVGLAIANVGLASCMHGGAATSFKSSTALSRNFPYKTPRDKKINKLCDLRFRTRP